MYGFFSVTEIHPHNQGNAVFNISVLGSLFKVASIHYPVKFFNNPTQQYKLFY